MGSSGAAVYGIALICAPETSARMQKARGDMAADDYEKGFLSVLASLGPTLNPGIELERAGTVRGGELCRDVHLTFCGVD